MIQAVPNLLHLDQKGFVPSRRLDDAVLKTTHIMEHCKTNHKPAYMMLLDQEKAFDRVDRNYMHKVISQFNFPDRIQQLIKAIYNTTSAKITINGKLSRTITLCSGVRQGCPLSPTLFALCIEPLGNLIRQDRFYKGITIPNVGTFKLSKFADDTTFFIRDQQDLNIALQKLNIYEHGTGAKANVSKTEILPIGPNTHAETNPLSHPAITLLPYDSSVRFLGVQISNIPLPDSFWEVQIQKLQTTLNMWNQVHLTYSGRIFVCRQQALASIWFHAKFHTLSDSHLRQIEKIIKKFVCKGKSKFLVQYNIAKLPRHLGGLNIPDIFLKNSLLRLKWIVELLDHNNNAEWRRMALPQLDQIANFRNMGSNILRYRHRLPHKKSLDFWRTNLNAARILKLDIHDPDPSPTVKRLKLTIVNIYRLSSHS